MSIAEIWKKGKEQLAVLERQDVFLATLIILVAFASFGLGRLSKIKTARVPVKIEQTEQIAAVGKAIGEVSSEVKSAGMYVASKNGAKYHFPWCSGAKSISEANKIWFNTVEEARAAGYTPAANCKGLE
ncbi:MAG: hypothetical protein WC673_01140 [Candidatus Paceibacterota bacterium]|jgi:hypothetical protein